MRLVKGDPKNKTVYSEDPIEMAKKWEKAGADMLHVVDLGCYTWNRFKSSNN